jgi:integrase
MTPRVPRLHVTLDADDGAPSLEFLDHAGETRSQVAAEADGVVQLRPADVNLVQGKIRVLASHSKNGEGRTLPMGPQLTALLQEALAGREDAATVLVDEEGTPWTPARLTNTFRALCKQIGVGNMGPHVLRHTFASRLVMAGVDLRTVQELMGHKSILMTMRYAHLSPDHKRAAMETLEQRFPIKSPAHFPNRGLAVVVGEEEKVVAVQ